MNISNADKFERYRSQFLSAYPVIVDQALEEEEEIPELAGPCQWIRKVSL